MVDGKAYEEDVVRGRKVQAYCAGLERDEHDYWAIVVVASCGLLELRDHLLALLLAAAIILEADLFGHH